MSERSNIYNNTAQDVITVRRQLAALLAPPRPCSTPFLDYQLGQEKEQNQETQRTESELSRKRAMNQAFMPQRESDPNPFLKAWNWYNNATIGTPNIEVNPNAPVPYEEFRELFLKQNNTPEVLTRWRPIDVPANRQMEFINENIRWEPLVKTAYDQVFGQGESQNAIYRDIPRKIGQFQPFGSGIGAIATKAIEPSQGWSALSPADIAGGLGDTLDILPGIKPVTQAISQAARAAGKYGGTVVRAPVLALVGAAGDLGDTGKLSKPGKAPKPEINNPSFPKEVGTGYTLGKAQPSVAKSNRPSWWPPLSTNPEKDLKELYLKATTDRKYIGKPVEYAEVTVDEAAKIKNITGLNIEGFTHSAFAEDFRHIYDEHTNNPIETLRGQVPLTEDDFGKIPEIIENPDTIAKSRTKAGLDAIKYSKRFNGNTIYIEEVRNGKKQLTAKSMYKYKTNTRAPVATSLEGNAPANTSETLPGVNNSIASNTNNFNETKLQQFQPYTEKWVALTRAAGKETRKVKQVRKAFRKVWFDQEPLTPQEA